MVAASRVSYFEGLVESAPDAVVVVADGLIVLVNRQTEVLFGYARDELLGQAIELLVPERVRAAHPAHRTHYAADAKTRPMGAHLDLTARRKDGSEFPVDISLSPLETEEGQVISAAIRDVTERKRAEEALQEAYQQLSSTVAEIERHDREVTLINQLGDMLQSCLTASEAHEVINHFAPRLFAGGSGALYTPGPSSQVLQAVAAWGLIPPTSLVLSAEQCWALRRGRVYMVEPGGGPHCEHLRDNPPKSYVCVPMTAQGEALGVLCSLLSDSGSSQVEPEHKLAITVADHLSLALANLTLRETLRNQSIRDPLTGVFNRRYMEATLERELLRASRAGHALGIIALDIDHFKDYNDEHGHSAGDALLRELCATLQQRVRGEDMVCRTGGEEFVVVLPATSREVTVARAESLLEAIGQLGGNGDRLPQSVTVSMGIAMFPDDGATGEAVFEAADEALYAAKRLGRNRIVEAGSDSRTGVA